MAANPNPLPNPNEKLVRVFDAEQESEAMVVSGLLESQGIDCEVTALDAPQDVLPIGGTVILVREEDAQRAVQIIEQYRRTPAEQLEEEADASLRERRGNSANSRDLRAHSRSIKKKARGAIGISAISDDVGILQTLPRPRAGDDGKRFALLPRLRRIAGAPRPATPRALELALPWWATFSTSADGSSVAINFSVGFSASASSRADVLP